MAGELTGGHSYCAGPVIQKKSFAAQLIAVMAGLVVATIRYHYPFLSNPIDFEPSATFYALVNLVTIVIYALLAIFTLFNMVILLIKEQGIESSDSLVAVLLGMMYGAGLMLGGALRPSVVIGFLTVSTKFWNPTLLFLMITVTLMNNIVFLLIVGKT